MKKEVRFDTKLDICQAIYINVGLKMFSLLSRAYFSFRHPILDWNRCSLKKIPKALPKYPGMTVKSISRMHPDNVNSYYHYVVVEHKDFPGKFYVTKYWTDQTKAEVLALENALQEHFENVFALPGYKPSKFRELTAKPHQAKQEETFDPRYGTYTNR